MTEHPLATERRIRETAYRYITGMLVDPTRDEVVEFLEKTGSDLDSKRVHERILDTIREFRNMVRN